MMAFLFLLMALDIALITWGKERASIALLFLILILGVLVFWHHWTSNLQINW